MIYSIDTDDFYPECSKRRYPLLRAIYSEFKANSNDKPGDKMRPSDLIVFQSVHVNNLRF
jgi:hypothetical protein